MGPITVSLVKMCFEHWTELEVSSVCVGVFVWGVLELCVEEARSESVSAFIKRLIEKANPLFSMSESSCSALLCAPLR